MFWTFYGVISMIYNVDHGNCDRLYNCTENLEQDQTRNQRECEVACTCESLKDRNFCNQ